MGTRNNLQLDKLNGLLRVINKIFIRLKDSFSRIYRPGMSAQGPVQVLIDWTGGRNITIGATVISLLVSLLAFKLFAVLFAFIFSIVVSTLIFVIAKTIFYKPKEYSIELDGETTILSYVKDVHVSGESEIVIHSQPGYGKEKNTFVMLQLLDSISILNCRNITSVTDTSYRDITIKYFHPVEGDYAINAFSNDGDVAFEVIEQSADQCRIEFLKPIRKNVRLNFIPS
ncbi:MAG: hypothetical protein DHS20C09_13690 [marine bacterium B5-7]|nr:MAG: hypothetical protein DHS20C09_13690 [marine bacterium B5-7]